MMKEIIDKILEENFDYDNGSLDFSCSKIEISLRPGENGEGFFQVYGQPGRTLEGQVFSSHLQMECLTTTISGSGENISYVFHTEGMEQGDVVKGEFYVITNQGEYYLPFVVTMMYSQISSSMGPVKNLFHFANLAKANPEEALKLFYTKEFEGIFSGSEGQYLQIYKGLSAYHGNPQNMEEFLISINKKQKIEYLTEEKEIFLEDPEDVVAYPLEITKNGWGYVELKVELEGEFLRVEKECLGDDDFLGNSCKLPLYIDSKLLHGGKNYGKVTLYNAYDEMVIPVTVHNKVTPLRGKHALEKQRLVVQMMEYYQAFRMKKIGTSTWLKETGKLVDRLLAISQGDYSARLFQAQLLITQERDNEAGWILDHVRDELEAQRKQQPVLWAYYLYLTSLISREEAYVDEITEEVEGLYKRNREQWRIAWLLLYLSPEYGKSATKKLLFLEEQFHRGCTSPVLYIEAMVLINQNPSLLMKMGDFEIQLLSYGAKKEYLSREVVDQAVYLAGKMREYSGTVLRFLSLCYTQRNDDKVLQEICSLLIRGNKVGSKYFFWYEKGVEANLRITRLYEHYMMSLDLNGKVTVPRIVLMYFAYQSNLDYQRSAFLYATVHQNRESYPELYENYRNTIEQFVLEQISKLRVNRDLAYLYKQIIQPRMYTKQVAENLSRLLFVQLIQVQYRGIQKVVVYQPLAGVEHQYPVSDFQAYVPLFGGDYTLLFEDGAHNRYAASIPYTMEKLILPGRMVKDIAPLVQGQIGYDVFSCMQGQELGEVNADNVHRFCHLLEREEIQLNYRLEIGTKLLQYYYDHDEMEALDRYLEIVDYEKVSEKVRNEVIRYMILRGRDSQAYQLVCTYGPYQIDAKLLLRLVNSILQKAEVEESPQLTGLVNYVFQQGKYDTYVLRYLADYAQGMTRQLRDIYKAAEAFDMDTRGLCERILIQMLFTGSYVGEKMEIFVRYVKAGADPKVEAAFLSQCAYDFFVKDKITDEFIFQEIFRMHGAGEEISKLCKLALLRYYGENAKERMGEGVQSLSEEYKNMLYSFAQEMAREGIALKFLTEYVAKVPSLSYLQDRTIVEYQAKPGAKVLIHYIIEREEGSQGEYLTEEMQQAYGGVYFKSFSLFFGESLQYYIVEQWEEQEQLTESAAILKSDIDGSGGEGKYNLINDIVVADTLQDYQTVDNLLEEYYYKEFMRERLFRLS